MANRLKEYLFPNKEKNELDSTTIVIKGDELTNKKPINNANSSTKILTPKVFSQVEGAANELLSGKNVIVDLTNTELTEAKRICDFLNGVTFALNGKVEKIAKLVYLFSPKMD